MYFDRDKEVSAQAAKAAEKQKLIEKLKQQQHAGSGGRGGRGGRGSMKLFGILLGCAAGGVRRVGETRSSSAMPTSTRSPAQEMNGVSVLIQDGKIAEIGPKLVAAEGRSRSSKARACASIPALIDSATESRTVRKSRRCGSRWTRARSASSCRSCAR